MIKCIQSEKTYDSEDTRLCVLASTEAPTGKTTGTGIDALPDSARIADGSVCIDAANDKKYLFLNGTWYEINK